MTITDPQKARTITLTEGAWSALDTASPDIIKTLQGRPRRVAQPVL